MTHDQIIAKQNEEKLTNIRLLCGQLNDVAVKCEEAADNCGFWEILVGRRRTFRNNARIVWKHRELIMSAIGM